MTQLICSFPPILQKKCKVISIPNNINFMQALRVSFHCKERATIMWTTVLFALLVAAASAEYGWKPNSEYRYEVHSKTLASLNQVSNVYSGVMMRCQVVVIPKTVDHLIVTIPQSEYSYVQADLPQGPENMIPEENLKYQVLPLTKQPFEVKLKNGVVDEIVVSKEVPIWEINVIKSIVSQLQVDTQGQRLIPSKLNMVPKGEDELTAVYKVMEDTIEGECEVLYDITPLPKYVLLRTPELAPQPQLVGHGQFIDVVKTKNFTNCKHRPGYHFGLTGLTQWEPTANKMGEFLSRSSVSRIVISGNLKSYTIQSSVTTNQVILSPEIYNSQKGQVYSRVNLTLNSVHSAQGEQQGPTNGQTIKKLVYDFNSPWTNDQEARNRWDQSRGTTQGYKQGGVYSTEEGNETNKKHGRVGRSVTEIGNEVSRKQFEGHSSESTESISQEDWHQQIPTMTHAPEIPFLPYFVGYMGHSIQHSKEINVNQVVKKLIEEMTQQLQDASHIPEKNTLDRFTILTRVIQTMNLKQLQQATQELYVKTELESETPATPRHYGWMTFRDAVVQAGTGPCLMVIKEWILNGQIQGEQAAQVVATLPKTAVFPSTEYMQTFFELVKSEQVMKQQYLNTSAVFAFTALVRMSQVDRQTIHNHYPVHAFGRPTPKEDRTVVDKYIPYFAERLEQAVQEQDSQKIQVYIRAIGNMAHPKILRVFEPYLEGKKPMTVYQRTLIVVSLKKLTKTHPRLAKSVLYKTYSNVGEAYQVRVAAVYQLMKTHPSANMLQRMAQFTHEDPSYQVSAAVKSIIRSYAHLQGKDNRQKRENARAAVHLLNPQEFGVHLSHANITDYIVKGFDLGYTQYFTHIGSQNSLIPESIFYELVRNVNGYKYITDKFSGMVSSVGVFRDLLEDMVDFGGKGQEGGKHAETLEQIYKMLKFEKNYNKQLEGNVVLEWLGATRLTTFDNHTIEDALFKFMGLLHRCQNPRHFNFQRIYNERKLTIAMPTATGFPFVYTLNTPTLVSFFGKVTVKTQPELTKAGKGFVLPENYGIEADVKMQYSTRTQSKITFITPFDHQHYIAGVDRNVQVLVPVKTRIDINLIDKRVKVQVVSLDEGKKYNLLHYSVWPYISRHNILEFKPIAEVADTHRIKVREPFKFNEKIGEKTGLILLVQGQTERRFFDLKTLYDLFQSHTITSMLAYPTYFTTIQHTVVDVVFDPQVSNCKSILLTAACVTDYHGQVGKSAGTESNLAKPTDNKIASEVRVKEFVERAMAGIKDAEPFAVDFGLEMQGDKPVQYVATVAYASSPIEDQYRFLMYLRQMDNKNFEICLNSLAQTQTVSKTEGIKAVETEPMSNVRIGVSLGETCADMPQVEIVGKLRRTPERKQYLLQTPLYAQAKGATERGFTLEPSQLKIAQEAKVLDNYHFQMKFHDIPENMRNMTYKVYSILRHALYFYVSENPFGEKTQEGQAEMIVQFSPDLKSLRSYIHTPVGGAMFNDVRVPEYVGKILTPRRAKETVKVIGDTLFEGRYETSCNFDNKQVRTFSNITYPVQLGKVWYTAMITKPVYQPTTNGFECFGKKHVAAVLLKEGEGEKKEVRLILDAGNTVVAEILPEQGNIFVSINGEKQPVTPEKVHRYQREGMNGKKYTLVKYYGTRTGGVVLMAPEHDIKILYLGKIVRISLGPKNTKTVNGLCGPRSGERFYYMTPQGYVLNNPEQFVSTWALSEEGRIGELKRQAEEYSQYRKTVIPSNYVSEQDAGRANFLGRTYKNLDKSAQDYDSTSSESNESTGTRNRKSVQGAVGCTTKRIISVEKDGKHCFSLNPEVTCTSQCHPEGTETKTGEFYCVEKSSTSEHWQKMIARGANPDFRNKGETEEIQFEYPVKCTRN